MSNLIIQIGYAANPPHFEVRHIDEGHGLPIWGSDNALARNEALLQRVKDNRDKYTLIESIIVHGKRHIQLVETISVSLWAEREYEDGPGYALQEVDGALVCSYFGRTCCSICIFIDS